MSVSHLARQRGKMLDEIMAHHRERLPKVMREVPLADVQALAMTAPPPRDLYAALSRPGLALIAECKKASPSRGLLLSDYDPVRLAQTYVRGGAAAISVLTDGRHFQGSLSHLQAVRTAFEEAGEGVPLLRKDFIFHPYQVYEARAAGADAILLIAAVLSRTQMRDLLALAHRLGMAALVEIHDAAELAWTLPLGPRIIGINNRNLQTFEVDMAHSLHLRPHIPAAVRVVAESGIRTADQVRALREAGFDAILVGETLVRSPNILQAVRALAAAGVD